MALERIGEYEIRFEIGRGGFGSVYLAFDPRVQRLVAIKVLDGEVDADRVTRFRTEAMAAGNLRHKNIVTVHGYGEEQGRPYLVMEYLDGHDLQQLIQTQNPLPLLEKVNVMSQIADGLICAHNNKVVHRDVKPANIKVLADGSVKIMDFGIARLLREESARLTQTGLMVGTVSYMAPEQFISAEVDALCDIWAYGVIYYQFLTGRHPFHAPDPGTTMYKIANENPAPVRSLSPDCPVALERIIERLLSKDRDGRYQNLDDVQFDVSPVLRDLQGQKNAHSIEQAQRLAWERRWEEAGALIRKVLDVDPSHAQARALWESIQEELRRRTLRPRVAALVRQAETEAERRNFQYAIKAAESALKLAPNEPSVIELRRRIQTDFEGAQRAGRLLEQAARQLDYLDLASARQNTLAALENDRGNPEAARLLDRIGAAIEEQERKQRWNEDLSRAEVLLGIGALEDAHGLIARLEREYPEATEVGRLSSRLEQQREENDRRSRFQEGLQAAEQDVLTGRLPEAIAKLQTLSEQFPQDRQIGDLLTQARELFATRQRNLHCEQIMADARRLIPAQEFGRALEILDRGLESYPAYSPLVETRNAVREAQTNRDRALRIQEGVERSRELRREERWEEALSHVSHLLTVHPGESALEAERETIRREMAERARVQAISETVARGRSMLVEGRVEEAAEFLRRNVAALGDDPRLLAPLAQAQAALREVEKQKDLAALLDRARGLEAAGQIDAAVRAMEGGAERHGSSAEFEQAAADLKRKQNVKVHARAIEQSLQRKDWTAAQEAVQRARREHPAEAQWAEFASRASAGGMEAAIERCLEIGDLAEARAKLAEARGLPLAEGWERFQTAIEKAQLRRDRLAEARGSIADGKPLEAETALQELLRQFPGDGEMGALLKDVRERRERQERETRRQEQKERARKLLGRGQHDATIELLRSVVGEFPTDEEAREELRQAIAAKEQAEQARIYAEGRAEVRAAILKGEHGAALKKVRTMLKQFPDDAGLEQDRTEIDAASEAKKREREHQRQRERALKMAKEGEAEPAQRLLEPLLRESPQDAELREAWRTVSSVRRDRADWLKVHEEISAIEELYRKGKAASVKDRAERLLAMVEEPRARKCLRWAEDTLAREAAAGKRGWGIVRSSDVPFIVGGVVVFVVAAILIVVRFFAR